jgi:hypothetical protein
MMKPDGTGLVLIGDTAGIASATETSGVLDISNLVGYIPGSVLVTSNQGSSASLTVLINPHAALAGDFNGDGGVDAADYVVWRKGLGSTYTTDDYQVWSAQFGRALAGSGSRLGPTFLASVPEPTTLAFVLGAVAICFFGRPVRGYQP